MILFTSLCASRGIAAAILFLPAVCLRGISIRIASNSFTKGSNELFSISFSLMFVRVELLQTFPRISNVCSVAKVTPFCRRYVPCHPHYSFCLSKHLVKVKGGIWYRY